MCVWGGGCETYVVHHLVSTGQLTYALVVHNVSLYRLGAAQDNFTCSLSIFLMMYNAVLSVSDYEMHNVEGVRQC